MVPTIHIHFPPCETCINTVQLKKYIFFFHTVARHNQNNFDEGQFPIRGNLRGKLTCCQKEVEVKGVSKMLLSLRINYFPSREGFVHN